MKNCIITTTAQQTQDFAQEFSNTLIGGETILLNGDLGAGKTHFVKGIASGLGIDDVITSPTFALRWIHGTAFAVPLPRSTTPSIN